MGILNPGPNPRNDHRSFYSGRRFACLGALFSLFLIASIPLIAQSGSSAQPPATQSQSQGQGAPPCSNAPPILKRGSQPDLPPCPEPPQDASAPADSVRLRAPSPDAPLIERARYAALQFSQKLPNFICQEYMARYAQQGEDKRLLDLVSAEVTYNNGQESYRNVKLDQHPTDKGIEQLNGSWSVGEFASTLLIFFLLTRTRSSSPAVCLPLRVNMPRFTTFECGVKIRTGGCKRNLRLCIRLTKAPSGWIRQPRTSCALRCRPSTCRRISRWIRSNPRWIIPT